VRTLTTFLLACSGARDECIRVDLRSGSLTLLESRAAEDERKRRRQGAATRPQPRLAGGRRKRNSAATMRVGKRRSSVGWGELSVLAACRHAREDAPVSAYRSTTPICRDVGSCPSLTRCGVPFARAALAKPSVTSIRPTSTNPHQLGLGQDSRGRDIGRDTAPRAGDSRDSVRCADIVLRLPAASSGRVGGPECCAKPLQPLAGQAQAKSSIVNARASVNRQAHFGGQIEAEAERNGVASATEMHGAFRHSDTCGPSRHLLLRSARKAQEVKGNKS
jgi:hypothetical protein